MDTTIAQIVISAISGGLVSIILLFIYAGRYIEKIDQLEKCDLNGRLSKLEGKFETSKDLSSFIQRKSPLKLTDRGRDLLQRSGGTAFIDGNKAQLIDAIRSRSPKTAYDVQELSKQVIEEQSGSDGFIPIKNYIFNKGIELEVIQIVISIYLRDIALKELNFDLKDIES